MPATYLQLQSRLHADGELELMLTAVPLREPAADEVVVRIEAAPINPSDLGAMIGPADISRMRVEHSGGMKRVVIPVPREAMHAMAARIGIAVPAGIEGAGVVVAAGSSREAQALVGRLVAISAGAMYAQYRIAKVVDLMVMEGDTTAVEAASSFINPVTALGMVETRNRERHAGLIHSAAASNLGQMLNRLCIVERIPLVNIVRNEAQVKILQDIGAAYIVNLSSNSFTEDLTSAIAATNATLYFDVVGGGQLVSQVLTAMESVQSGKLAEFQRYGSAVHKQVYICGRLDPRPTELIHAFGSSWGVGGWLLPNFLTQIGPEAAMRLKARVVRELKTTFLSHYTRTISLFETLDPAIIAACQRRATGEKYLIAPQL